MRLIHDADGSKIYASAENYGKGPVWEFYLYGLAASGDPRIVPSLAMACDLTGADPIAILAAFPDLASA